MLYNLIFNLLIAHIICDFYLQTPTSCANKVSNLWKSPALWCHVVLIGGLSWMAIWSLSAWWLVLLIMISHLIIDWQKSVLQIKYKVYKISPSGYLTKGKNSRYNTYFFLGDQLLHILMIVIISCIWYTKNNDWNQFQWLQSLLHNHPLRVYTSIALLLILKPVNLLILQILESCKLDKAINSEGNDYFHAGALIGYTERSLMLIFVVLAQYEAIGFLIAAKSILRFSEASSGNVKSEYVLSGTLLSLLFSLFIGLCVIKMPIL